MPVICDTGGGTCKKQHVSRSVFNGHVYWVTVFVTYCMYYLCVEVLSLMPSLLHHIYIPWWTDSMLMPSVAYNKVVHPFPPQPFLCKGIKYVKVAQSRLMVPAHMSCPSPKHDSSGSIKTDTGEDLHSLVWGFSGEGHRQTNCMVPEAKTRAHFIPHLKAKLS